MNVPCPYRNGLPIRDGASFGAEEHPTVHGPVAAQCRVGGGWATLSLPQP